jgi:hypothetical protein
VSCTSYPVPACWELDTTFAGGCNPATGNCVTRRKVCTPTGCNDVVCNPATNLCEDQPTAGCDGACACSLNPATTSTTCIKYRCDPADLTNCLAPTNTDCSLLEPDTCSTANPCDEITGCTFNDNDCSSVTSSDACHIVVKDPTAVGCCVEKVINCDEGDPCKTYGCDTATGCTAVDACIMDPTNLCLIVGCDQNGCTSTPVVCTAPFCQTTVCNPSTGLCDYTPVDCDDGDACTTDSCDTTTGNCGHVPIVCDDQDVCTVDACDPTTGACQYSAPKSCDDSNTCTIDVCDPVNDCQHTPDDLVCSSADPCVVGFCDLTLGCQTKPAYCPPQQTDTWCLLTICVPYQGCSNESRACNASTLVCEISACNEDTDKCESTPLICGLGVDTGVIVGSVVVSAAVIGGVVAGAVLAVAGLGGGGAVAYFQLAAAGEDSNTANNPLYADPNQSAVNPLYQV